MAMKTTKQEPIDVETAMHDTLPTDDAEYSDLKPAKKSSKGKTRVDKAAKESKVNKSKAKVEADVKRNKNGTVKINGYALLKAKNAMLSNMEHVARPKPAGLPGCLQGYTFVFTGELNSLSREEAADIVKSHGGRVTTAISGKTSYVVQGEGAGPRKMEKVSALGTTILNEDSFYKLVNSLGETE